MKKNSKNYYVFWLTLFLISIFSIGTYAQNEEDEKIELNSIAFTGNTYFSDSELKNVIQLKESSGWFSQFLNSFTNFGSPPSYFDSLQTDDDIAILEDYYKSYGFFKAIITADYILSNHNKEANLVYHITEGEASQIRQFSITGLENLMPEFYEEIVNIISVDSADQYTSTLLHHNNKQILDFLRDHGYFHAKNSWPIVEMDTVINVVDISVDFDLGNRYKVSDVTVEKSGKGAKYVSKNLIKEITNINPGDFYSYHDLKLAQVRLYRTNLFSSAIVAGVDVDSNISIVPIRIATEVGALNEFSPEIIAINENNIFKFGLGLSFVKKNFLGGARKLTISTSAAAQNIPEFITDFNLENDNIFGFADGRIILEQPFLFGKPINTQLETFFTLEKQKNDWNANIFGAKLNLNFELSNYTYLTSFSTHLNWQNYKYVFQEKYIRDRFGLDSTFSGQLVTKNTNTVIGTFMVANKTDALLFPTRGYSLSLLVEDGNSIPFLLSKIGSYNFNHPTYYKFVLSTSLYLPFFEKGNSAFGLKFKIGNIHTYTSTGDKFNIPLNQRFRAGGSNSIRGWGANKLAVSDVNLLPDNLTKEEIDNIKKRKIAPGGFFLFEGSIETRTHLTEMIGAALFVDYGNVWNSTKDFRFDRLAIAAGFGFRFYTEYIPFRIDFGLKLYNPEDRRNLFARFNDKGGFLNNMKFQFGIGEAF